MGVSVDTAPDSADEVHGWEGRTDDGVAGTQLGMDDADAEDRTDGVDGGASADEDGGDGTAEHAVHGAPRVSWRDKS